jgi:selenocysteine lyase/cysteine desulfurase
MVRVVRRCSRVANSGVYSAELGGLLLDGCKEVGFPGLPGTFKLLSKLLGQSEPSRITLHYNTTEAFRAALRLVTGSLGAANPLTVLLTDCEYPGFAQTVRDELPHARRVTAAIRSKLWRLPPSIAGYHLVTMIEKVRPQVVLLSHVCRTTGVALPVFELIRHFRRILPATVWIIDGAQAVGNLELDAHDVSEADYYLGSAHKHLLSAVLGLCVHRARVSADRCNATIVRYDSTNPLRSVRSTIELKPLFAAAYAARSFLGDSSLVHNHTKALARDLADGLRRLIPLAVIPEPDGAIVSCRLAIGPAENYFRCLSARGVRLSLLPDSDMTYGLRFSIHANHGSGDVRRLLDFVNQAGKALGRKELAA